MSASPFASLAGRRAVVTGASTGIGRAIACELAAAGANVVVHCRRSLDEARETAARIEQTGQTAVACPADLSDASQIEPFFEQASAALGGVDIWVNNAGVDLLTGSDAGLPFEQKLQRLFDVDVTAAIRLSRLAGAHMTAAGGGVILNIGWDQAERGMGGASGEMFAASKSAVMGFSRSLAVSLAPLVRVNCIAPGWIRTAWGEQASETWHERVLRETPLARWGTPEDVARLARFLASEEAGFITGQVINVNGGAVR